MAIDFPASPATGDSFIVNNTKWTWNGTSWRSSVPDMNIRSIIVTDNANVWGTLYTGNVYGNNLTWMGGTLNAAFTQANTGTGGGPAFDQANTARTHANSSFLTANAAYDQANTARNHANAAFAQANSGGGGSANNAFGNIFVSHVESAYSWSLGTNIAITANATSNTLKLIGGYGVNLSVDTANSAVRFNVSNVVLTSNNTSNIAGSANGDMITYDNVSNTWVSNSRTNVQAILQIHRACVNYFENIATIAKTVTLIYKMPVRANLEYIDHKLAVGNLTLDVKRNGNTINGFSNVIVNTSSQSNARGAVTNTDFVFVANDKLSITIVGPSSNAADFELSLNFIRG